MVTLHRGTTKGVNVKALCGGFHVHWDATLDPTQVQMDDEVVEGLHPTDHGFDRKLKK